METHTYKDNIGSVRRWRLYNKTALQNIEFEPYGGIYSADNTTTPYDPIFALHPFDPAAQMYRAPYRMYDPDSTRWTERDPLGMVDGPNMYAYARGGVVDRVDPMGLWCIPILRTPWMEGEAFPLAAYRYKVYFITADLMGPVVLALWQRYQLWIVSYWRRTTYFCCGEGNCENDCGMKEKIEFKKDKEWRFRDQHRDYGWRNGQGHTCGVNPWTGQYVCDQDDPNIPD